MAFKQLALWKYLRANPGQRPQDLAAHFGWTRPNTSGLLRCLKNRGCTTTTGRNRATRHFATGPRPEDMTGLHANTIANLRPGSAVEIAKANKERSRLAALGELRCRKGRSVTLPAHESLHAGVPALEQCWARP
jgi:hypothetical protein